MGCCASAPPVHAYYEPTGELVQYGYPKQHFPKKELDYVSVHDLTRFQPDDVCYVISADWHSHWIEYATKTSPKIPSTIDNHVLLEVDHQRLRKGLKHKKDYRPISKAVWQYLFHLYGGGPVIIFKVPPGFSEESYLKGHWIKKIELSSIVTIIHPSEFPTKSEYAVVHNPMGKETVAANNASLAANLMINDLSKKKFEQAKELTKEINASNAEAIGAMMAKDMAKKKMEEARELERQQNIEQSNVAANLFSSGLADKRREEARQADASAKVSQQEEAIAIFSKGAVKKQFKEALKAGNKKQAEILAATMLKNAWRGKKARQQVKELKARKQRLMEEAMARKLQSKYRSRLARKKVERLKAEKQRLREEACAVMLQSSWRIKKARDKVNRLKIERQKLLEEGAALKVQSRWRIKQAKRKVNHLKYERDEKAAKKAKALFTIIQFLLLFKAKLKYRKLLRAKKQIFIVNLKKAHDINVGDVTTSDPYILLHVEAAASSNTGQGKASASGGSTVSVFRSKVIYSTLNPEWNEDLFAVNVTGNDSLVLTMMDKDNFTSDDFLGQTVLPLSRYPGLYEGRVIDLHRLPIESFTIPIRDEKGKPKTLSEVETPGKGDISLSVRMAKPFMTHSGWVLKQASQLISLGGSQFKPRFMVLLEGVLNYYDSEHTLDHSRGTIKCADITVLNYGPDKNGELTLQIKSDTEEWFLRWQEGESDANKAAWLNKLAVCSPNLRDRESFRQRASSISNSPSKLPVVDVKNTGKLQKRASLLFGGKK